MLMLDIIVTHYDEPWKTGRKFFDMLACQRGIDFDDIRVLLIHDGKDKWIEQEAFGLYPYRVLQYRIDHGGVSKARNYGLRVAEGPWVQFCDFDDMYSNAYALYGILEHMRREDVDYMWTPFLMEYRKKDGTLTAKEHGENITFIHGKFFRRDWLLGNRIFFPEGIHYSEDSAFGAIVNELAKDGRRGKIKAQFPAYIWCVRDDSVSMNPANEERNLTGFIERNFWVVEEYKRREIPHRLMVGRMFADAYWAFHRKDRKFPEKEAEFRKRASAYLDDLRSLDRADVEAVLNAARTAFIGKEDPKAESFSEWLARAFE